MSSVKWVKIMVDMFDNRKIKHLRHLPEGNNIVLIWVMLLTMAGRCNAGGMIFLTENIPYTPKMLADELGFEENTVRMALKALEEFGMITTAQAHFAIAGWNEYQNVEGMDKIREQNRRRVAAHRQRQKLLAEGVTPCNVTDNVTVTQCHAADIDIDIEKEEEKDDICDSVPESPAPKPARPVKHKYGEYGNVLLTDEELQKLKDTFYDWEERIERLSGYIASTGKKYKSHYATIRNWAKKDQQAQPIRQAAPVSRKPTKAEELNDFYNMADQWANEGA